MGYNNSMKTRKKQPQNPYLWIGVVIGFLPLITIIAVIPSTHRTSTPPTPTDTNHTESVTHPTDSTDETESKPEPEPAEPTPAPAPEPEPTPTPEPTSAPEPTTPQQPTTYNSTPACYHEEAGRCWDDYEDEAYSAGTYDAMYGYYGASLDYADDCDALCRDILEDAYDEGWYDANY